MLLIASAYINGVPFGTRTIVVPAILSCQDCHSSSNETQMKPRPATAMDRNPPRARTIATLQSMGRSSSRTSFRPQMIPPIVVPFVALVGAIRLAKPKSVWARRRYSGRKLERANGRFGRRYHARQEKLLDLIGGTPDSGADNKK